MHIETRDLRKIGIWFLMAAFAFVAIALPLLALDAPDSIAELTFTLILILEILVVLSLDPQRVVFTGYRFGIAPRSPPTQ